MTKTVVIGKKVGGVTQPVHFMVMSGDKIVLVDAATGHSPKKVMTKIVDKNLYIYAEGAAEPSVILNDYLVFEKTVQIQGVGQGGAYYNYAASESGVMEMSSGPTVAPAAADEPWLSTDAMLGIGILAVAGGIAIAAGGGGGGGDSTAPAPSTTLTASLVDSAVQGVSYTTSSGLSGVTLANGSFNYKAGDIITFKVGNATIGTINAININADGLVLPQDIVGVDRANTTDPRVVNIAQFLQSLDSVGTVADGITITNTSIGTLDVQTATDTQFTEAGITSLVSEATAISNLVTGTAIAIDTTGSTASAHPTVTISDDESAVGNIAGTSVLYTFTFSEAVTGFTAADVTVVNGTKGTFTQLSTSLYSLAITPTAGVEGNMTVDVAAGVATNSTATPNDAAFQSNQTVDMLAPSVTSVTLSDTALTIGETSAVTIVFSEAVKNFDNTDVSLAGANGTLSALGSSDNITWTGLFTPTATISDASNKIQVMNTYTDMAGNAGALGASANYTIDTRSSPVTAPTFALTHDNGLSATDNITYSNGMTVALGAGITNWEYSFNGGTTWTTGTAPISGIGSFNLVENVSYAAGDIQVRQTDSGGSVSTIATNTQTILVDTIASTLTITDDEPMITANMDGSNTDGSVDANGADILYEFAFDETVKDFTASDITILHGTAKTFTKIDDLHYTLGVTPDAGYEGDMTVGVLTTTYHDIAGNAGNVSSDTSSVQVVDMRAPFPDYSLSPNFIQADAEFQRLILTFDENLEQVNSTLTSYFGVMTGYALNTVKAIGVSDNTAGMADNQVFLYLENPFDNTAGITVSYTHATGDLSTVIQDLAGNDATTFNGYIADTLAPTAEITMSDTVLSSGDIPTVTFTFSEKVLDFSSSDVSLTDANGILGTLLSADGGVTWTTTFTPTIGIQDASNVITLNGAYTDAAGNIGAGATSSNYSIDTKAPVFVSAVGNNANDTITITFDEVLDAANHAQGSDFYVTDGSLTADPTDGTAVNAINVLGVGMSDNTITLSMEPMASGTWKVIYTDTVGNTLYAIQDVYGSDSTGFSWTAVI